MNAVTKYVGMADDVLEAKAEEAAIYSPLIQELLLRWRKVVDEPHTMHRAASARSAKPRCSSNRTKATTATN